MNRSPRTGLFVPDYAAATLAADFAWWCEHNIVQTVDQFAGTPLKLELWQKRFFSEALALEDTGTPYWKLVVLEVARKNGKTAMIAAYALYHLLEALGKPEVLMAASTDKQAGRLYGATVDYCRMAPQLDEQVHLREYNGRIDRVDGLGSLVRLASEPGSAHGYNPSLVCIDELHAWTTPSLRKAWGAFTTGGGARQASQVFSITTAGEAAERASSILGRLVSGMRAHDDVDVDGTLTISRNHAARTLVFAYEAQTKDRYDVKALKRANPASWVTTKYLREQANNTDGLTDAEVLQYHGCVWAATETTWIEPEAWEACASDRRLQENEKVVLGFDGSERRDMTVLAAATLDGHVEVLEAWRRPDGAPPDWRIPRADVHRAIELAFKRYDVQELAADPPGWYSEIEEWAELYEGAVLEFETKQPKRMAPACERFQKDADHGELTHTGDRLLAEHVGHCIAKETAWGTLVTKEHPDSPRKIDAAIAAVIAYDRAMWHASNTRQPMVAWA